MVEDEDRVDVDVAVVVVALFVVVSIMSSPTKQTKINKNRH